MPLELGPQTRHQHAMTSQEMLSFGALAPNRIQERLRLLGHRLPYNFFGRKLASLLLWPAGGRTDKPRDVAIFGSQRARLHLRDNLCEKRVYLTPGHWDPEERTRLAAAIAAQDGEIFYFLDVGANAGLYSLFARAAAIAAERPIRIAGVEPDPYMRARMRFNLEASNAESDITIYPYAATGERGPVRFAINTRNRGASRLDETGERQIDGVPLIDILAEARFPRVDAMKIDIEGAEFPALSAFFDKAPEQLWPKLVIIETAHDQHERPTLQLFLDRRYAVVAKSRLNAVLERGDVTLNNNP